MPRSFFITVCLLVLTICPTDFKIAQAAGPKYLFKIASLAPEGSVWTKRFQDFAAEVKTKTNGEIGFKIYAGGVMGDDRSMYRKMRVGQIQAGGFTMTGISEVVSDFRVLGIPFLFHSYDEVDYVIKGITPMLKKAFDEQNMVLLGMTEVGFLYAFSSSPMTVVDDLRRSKAWVPEGDPISAQYFKDIGMSPTPLAIPDVLTSLQTGLIDTVFNSFYGAIVLQWFTRTNYVIDIPFAYSYGALVFDKRAFSKLPAAYVRIMEDSINTHFSLLLKDTRQSNKDSLKVLKQNGVTMVEATPEAKTELRDYRDITVKKLNRKYFSKEIYEKVEQLLNEFRKTHSQSNYDPNALISGLATPWTAHPY